jgi:hypothetical protein
VVTTEATPTAVVELVVLVHVTVVAEVEAPIPALGQEVIVTLHAALAVLVKAGVHPSVDVPVIGYALVMHTATKISPHSSA